MDTNNIYIIFKAGTINFNKLKKLIPEDINDVDSIKVQTNRGTKKFPRCNSINVDKEWINECKLLQNNKLKVVISYPKYFSNTNNYIIKSDEEIRLLHNSLIELIEEKICTSVDREDLFHSRIDYPENLEIEDEFKDWGNIFILIGKAVKGENTLYNEIDKETGRNIAKGIFFQLQRDIDINFYNQRANILKKSNIDIGREVIRCEIRFMNEKVIKKYFGTNKVNEIRYKDIKQVWKDIFINNIMKYILKQLKEEVTFLEKELKNYLEKRKHHIIEDFTSYYQTRIFDYEILAIIIDNLDIADRTKRNYKKCAREKLEAIERSSIYDTKVIGNMERLNYMLRNFLGRGYKNFDIKEELLKLL